MTLTDVELKAYQLLFTEGLSAEAASQKLAEKGIDYSPARLRTYKQVIAAKIDREMREERMMEGMLESFDRTKLEFEDSVSRLKRWIDKFDAEGKDFQAMIANRDLIAQINTALRVLGKITNQMVSLHATKINVLNATDFVDAYKQNLEAQFEKQKARVENGRLIFEQPTPEMLDDYYRWLSKRKQTIEIPIG